MTKSKHVRYTWTFRKSFIGSSVTAPAVAEALQKLAGRRTLGNLEPDEVVEAARDPKSPLHPLIFNKTKDEAAEFYYLERARLMLSSLMRVKINGNGKRVEGSIATHAYVYSREQDSHVPYGKVLSTAALRAEYVEVALAELRAWTYKYVELTELAPLIAVIKPYLTKE